MDFGKLFGFGILETLKEVIMHPLLNKLWERGVPVVADRISKSFEEHRAELVEFIVHLEDEMASRKLLERIEARQRGLNRSYAPHHQYEPSSEERCVKALEKLFMYLSSPDELGNRVQMFVDLGRMPDRQFDAVVEALTNDIIAQWLRQAAFLVRTHGKPAVDALRSAWPHIVTAWPEVRELPKRADHAVAMRINGASDRLEAASLPSPGSSFHLTKDVVIAFATIIILVILGFVF